MDEPEGLIARERRALELFGAMLDLDQSARAAWLDAHTRDDPELKRRVTRMIEADRILSLRTGGAFRNGDDETAPEQLGAYRITGLIGSGGMGSVYAGTRMRGDFEHQVAIKLIKPGVLSQSLVERFRRERQLIARMNHPHIARLFDGGESEAGRPYFVMERIDGVPLNDWLAEQSPGLDARLMLFLQICDAVGYAHRQLVVHRDLTPANILIDRQGQAKLIDFGIACLAEDAATHEPGDPSFCAATLTPGYAAPERLRGSVATTLGDIYSAGRLLARLIDKPRGRELQAIIDKACASDPDARYRTIEALADDIERIREGRPVSPLAHLPGYRLAAIARRHWRALGVAVAILVASVSGVVSLAIAWREAEVARAASDQRFSEVRALSKFLLYDLYDELEKVPGNTVALNRIADRARLYLNRLSTAPGAPRQLRVETAMAYKRLSDVLGTPLAANLGRRVEAGEMLAKAVAELRVLHSETPQDRVVAEALAEALYSQAVFAFIALDDNDQAHERASESARLFWQIASGEEAARLALRAIDAEIEAALPLGWNGKGQQGIAMLRRSLANLNRQVRDYGSNAETNAIQARLHNALAETIGREADMGKASHADALVHSDRAIAAYRMLAKASSQPGGATRSLAIGLYKRSLNLYSLERYAAAIHDLEEAKQIIEDLIKRDPADAGLFRTLAAVDEQLGLALAHDGKGQQAIAMAEAATATKRAALAKQPNNPGLMGDYASNLLVAAEIWDIAGDPRGACRLARESTTIFAAAERLAPLSNYDRELVQNSLRRLRERTCST